MTTGEVILKAWIDRIAQPGRTFRYTSNGPESLSMGEEAKLRPASWPACRA